MANEEPKDVSSFDEEWNPTKDVNKNRRTVASDDDFIDAYYIGYRENQGPKKNSIVHTVQKKDGSRYSIWGTHILNDLLMSKITPGQYIRVKWLGEMVPKQKGGNPYHGWKVLLFEQTPVLDPSTLGKMKADMPNTDPAPSSRQTANANDFPTESLAVTDDLPF